MASKILTPEGFIMLFIAGVFDALGFGCFVLVFVFGIGIIPGRIVSFTGFAVIAIWRFVRAGDTSTTKKEFGDDEADISEGEIEEMEGEKAEREKRKAKRDASAASGGKGRKALAKAGDAKDKIKEMMSVSAFIKKHWKKLLLEALPIVGDIYPAFTAMVISELK